VQDIARELRVDRTTVYRQVGNVERIMRLLMARELHRLLEALPDSLLGLQGPAVIVDVLATLFCIFGWLSPDINQRPLPNPLGSFFFRQTPHGWTDVVTVVVVWAYSIGVIIVIAITYFLLNQIPGLSDLGRKNRNVHDTQMENIVGHLSKLALRHEKDEHGESRWALVTKSQEEAEDD